MGFSEAFALASELYIRKVHVVTHCLATINHLKGQYLGPNAAIIGEIRKKLEEFDVYHISLEKREKNWEPHDLAKADVTLDVGRHSVCSVNKVVLTPKKLF